ncbi:MAG: tRNA lysidine(34) synthetase TilS [Gemmatimonadota bacterium]
MQANLRERFSRRLDRRPDLLPPNRCVLVALSGGGDSMALLHLLLGETDRRGLRIVAAHFDHRAQPESAADAERVRAWAADLGVACEIGAPADRLPATQAAFRAARYDFLSRVAERQGARRIATGHHADDQVETVLLRAARGTGLRGLAGIPERRGRIVRPLLSFRRAALREFLSAEGIECLDDPSNRDPRWARGRVRTRVLPALVDAHGPGIHARILELADRARALDRRLDRAAARTLDLAVRAVGTPRESKAPPLRLDRHRLTDAHPELRARALRIAARRMGVRLTRGGTRVGEAFITRGRSGSSVDIGGGLWLGREYDVLLLGDGTADGAEESVLIRMPGEGSARLRLGAATYRVRWSVGSWVDVGERRIAVPVRGGHYPYEIRGWRPGDRIRLAAGSRKLKKLFGDRRVPRSARSEVPVLADGTGRVLWVAGMARDRELETREDHGDRIVVELGLTARG